MFLWGFFGVDLGGLWVWWCDFIICIIFFCIFMKIVIDFVVWYVD